MDKYVFLRQLQVSDAHSFYRLLMQNAMEIMPFVYTPTVGEACQTYHLLPIDTRWVYITADDSGSVGRVLRERAPKDLNTDVGAMRPIGNQTDHGGASASSHQSIGNQINRGLKVAVVTDGERILGLGDLGAGGMAIAEGKILLYTVCAGVDPRDLLPVCLDVGTDNEKLLNDPLYKGLRRPRLRGALYDQLVEEFMSEMRAWQPRCLVQFEDFGNQNAFRILHKFRKKHLCFNDDIQGTACVALAGLLSATRLDDVKPLVRISQSPHSASLIAHTRLTFLFLPSGRADFSVLRRGRSRRGNRRARGDVSGEKVWAYARRSNEAVLLHGQQRLGNKSSTRKRRLRKADAQNSIRARRGSARGYDPTNRD